MPWSGCGIRGGPNADGSVGISSDPGPPDPGPRIPDHGKLEIGVADERRKSIGRHAEGCVHPDVGRQARALGSERSALRRLGAYHLKGSPADPNRLHASQSSGWFGQMIQRSNDGGKTWDAVGNKFVYDGVPGISGTTARLIRGNSNGSGTWNPLSAIPTRSMPAPRMPRCFARPTVGRTGRRCRGFATTAQVRTGHPAQEACAYTDPHRSLQPETDVHCDLSRRCVSHRRWRNDLAADQ